MKPPRALADPGAVPLRAGGLAEGQLTPGADFDTGDGAPPGTPAAPITALVDQLARPLPEDRRRGASKCRAPC